MSDTTLRLKAMQCLTENLGQVEAERFIFLIIKEPFDYTEWHRDMFDNTTQEELFELGKEYMAQLASDK